ncbi:hypothetical protein F52700_5862 [Fusarium sp. NRRL 52700]|nr:hypothetical protein F52700_5862 [Fusarium sp. NRRL 52700]
MKPGNILFLLLLSLISPSCALTEYISDNVTVASKSVQPCHLFGDSDLLGVGVRASFYISWAAGLLGYLLGALEEMKAPRVSFNILLLTLVIILIRNTSRGSLALLEWYIVIGLAFLAANVLLMVPIQPFELADEDESNEDESDSHSRPSNNPFPHHSPPRNEDAAERRDNSQWEDQTNNQEAATNGGNQPSLKSSRDLAEEQMRQDAEVRVKRYYSAFYSDPLGFGFLILLYGVIGCCLPWLYFMKPTSGRKEGCAVPIVLFGTSDMFNKHWQGFLKFTAVSGVLFAGLYILLGSYMIYRGIKMRKTYALTLELMKERKYSGIKLLRLDVANLKQALDDGETVTAPEAQTALQNLATAIQWAQKREEAAVTGEEQAMKLVKRASDLQEQYWVQRIIPRAIRGVMFVVLVGSGSLSIWFIEATIDKNYIDMDDDLGSSNGQLLALLVAVLTTVNFLWEVFKLKFEERKARKEADETVDHICDAARSL